MELIGSAGSSADSGIPAAWAAAMRAALLAAWAAEDIVELGLDLDFWEEANRCCPDARANHFPSTCRRCRVRDHFRCRWGVRVSDGELAVEDPEECEHKILLFTAQGSNFKNLILLFYLNVGCVP